MITPSVPPGKYRLRVLGKEAYQYLDLFSGCNNESVRWNPDEKKDYEAEENFNIPLVNQSQFSETYIMEDVGWSDLALRHDNSNYQEFRIYLLKVSRQSCALVCRQTAILF